MAKQTYALVLHSNAPPEFLKLFSNGYLREHEELKYLLCNSVDLVGNFVIAGVLRDDFSWSVHIPVGYIVAITDNSDPKTAIGFLPNVQ